MPLRDTRLASPVPSICPFLRFYGADGLTFPFERPADGNVCLALDEPLAQSTRQQELVCLVDAHANCPRYLRGMVVTPTGGARRGGRAFSPAVAASLVVLLVSAIVSVGYVAAAGGLTLPPDAVRGLVAGGSPTAGPPTTGASTTAPPTTATGSAGTAVATPGAASAPPSVVPTPAATPSPSPAETPTPTRSRAPKPTPGPTATPSPASTSDRFSVLSACPGRPDCWIYVVRSGDNLFSIAHWFGVSLDSIYAMNPWARTATLTAGQELRIPTPTR